MFSFFAVIVVGGSLGQEQVESGNTITLLISPTKIQIYFDNNIFD